MRIAYIVADGGIPVTGTKGASVHVREMVRALAVDHEVDLFCSRLGDEPYDLPTRSLHVIPNQKSRVAADPVIERDRRRLAAVARLRCLIEAEHRARPYDLLYERYSLFSDVGASMTDDYQLPYLLEVNAPLIVERQRVEPLPLAPLAWDIERYIFTRARALLAVSNAVRTYVVEQGGRPERVHVLPNGVDTSRFHGGISSQEVRTELSLAERFVVGFAGSLKPWHGVDLLIEAFAAVARPNWTLLIVGDGPERTHLEEQARILPESHHIVFTGAVPHERVPQYVSAMDLAVAPFRSVDNFYFSPLKLFEYLAMGKPVVASAVGQISEVIRDGENGVLFEPDNARALAQALIRVATDEQLRINLVAHAGREITTWHDIAHRAVALAFGPATVGFSS